MPPHNPDTRSGFGDNHAATEDALMAAHAQHMLKAGLIEKKMAKELSKPRRSYPGIEIEYTPAYLSTFPTYTGLNHDDMPTLEVALQRQAERDKAQLKLLANYRAGRIDIHGNPIVAEHGTAKRKRASKPHTSTAVPTDLSGDGDPTGNTTVPASSSPEQPHAKKQRTENQPKLTPVTSSSTSPKSDKSCRIVTLLVPHPGNPNYADIRYYQLAAMCRERSLPGRGKEQEVRNRLIQDDINVAKGKPRETVKMTQRKRKYKHVAPEYMGGKVVEKSSEGKVFVEEAVTAKSSDETVTAESSEGSSPPIKVRQRRRTGKAWQ